MPQPDARNRDFPQVLKESYDPALERIRVDAIVSDGIDGLIINPDGSINVNVISSDIDSSQYVSSYAEVTSVPSASTTTINTYTVPVAKEAFLQKIDVSGTNIAMYEVLVNAVVQDKARTYFGNSLNDTFDFSSFSQDGYRLVTGDIVLVRVTHNRPNVGDFNARIQIVEVDDNP